MGRTLIGGVGAAVALMALNSIGYTAPHVGEGQKRAREREVAPEPVGDPLNETRQVRRARERRQAKATGASS